MPRTQNFEIGDIEQYDAVFNRGCSDSELLQLSPGELQLSTTLIDFDGLRLEWNQFGQKVRIRDLHRTGGLMFGFVTSSAHRPNLDGCELDYGDVVVWQAHQEVEYVLAPGTSALIISVEDALLDTLGWTTSGATLRSVSKPQLKKLEQVCRQTTMAKPLRWGSESPPVHYWRDRILLALEIVLTGSLKPPAAASMSCGIRYFQLIKANGTPGRTETSLASCPVKQ